MLSNKNFAGNSLPQVYTFGTENNPVRAIVIDGNPYFIAKDVCDNLKLTNARVSIQSLDDDERRKYYLPRQGKTWCVSESGLYHLIFQSRKTEAKAFRKWVTSEVLPELRRTGRYQRGGTGTRRYQLYIPPTTWLDLRGEPYERCEAFGGVIRSISHGGEVWYSICDVLRAWGVKTSAWRNAAMLNMSAPDIACKIHLFGTAHPAWFCKEKGIALMYSVRRKPVQMSFNF